MLVQNIAHQAGINEDQARIALLTVAAHVKERFPMLKGVMEFVLEEQEANLKNHKPTITIFLQNPIGLN